MVIMDESEFSWNFLEIWFACKNWNFLSLMQILQHPVLPIPHPALTSISFPVSTLEALLPLLFYEHQACRHDVITCLLTLHVIVTWKCWPSWTHWPTGLPRHSCQYCLFSAGVGNKSSGISGTEDGCHSQHSDLLWNEHSSHAHGQEQFKRHWEPNVDWFPLPSALFIAYI